VLAPRGAAGQVVEVAGAWRALNAGDALVALGALSGEAAAAAAPAEQAAAEGVVVVRSSMTGTLYRRPAPDQPDFAPTGASVGARETVALVEVMKTFTPLAAPSAGAIERWLVEDGESVEADQPVAWLRP
jgi:acetyl-CoA carboxylase biotin carboxyl carrier protein